MPTRAMIPSPAQCRAARALIDWRRDDLAKRSGVGKRSIASFEKGETKLMRLNHEAVRQALEQAGVEFGDGGWMRLKPVKN